MSTELLTGQHEAGGGVIPFWRAVYEVARKDVLVFARTKRLYVTGGIFALGFLSLSLIFANFLNDLLGQGADILFGETVGLSRANAVMAFAIGLPLVGAFTFLNILGIVFTFDGIVREYEDKSLFLILSKPVTREAFVLGKYVGAVFSVGAIFMMVGTIAYFFVMMIMGEFASPGDFARYYLALGMLLMGMVALSAMALFWSAVSRSTVMSVLLSFLTWLIVLNVLSSSGFFYAAFSQNIDQSHPLVEATQYLNPSTSVGPSMLVMLNLAGETNALGISLPFGGLGLDPLLSQLSLLLFAAVFLGGAMLVVARRNFE